MVEAGSSPAAALVSGYHLAFGLGAALVGAAIVVAALVLRPAREDEHEALKDAAEAEPA